MQQKKRENKEEWTENEVKKEREMNSNRINDTHTYTRTKSKSKITESKIKQITNAIEIRQQEPKTMANIRFVFWLNEKESDSCLNI